MTWKFTKNGKRNKVKVSSSKKKRKRKKGKAKLRKRLINESLSECGKSRSKIISPEDKAKITQGNSLIGRSTLKQQEFLAKLGVDRKISVNWTKYKASQEIKKRLEKEGSHNQIHLLQDEN